MTREEFEVNSNQVCELKLLFSSERAFCPRPVVCAEPKLGVGGNIKFWAQNTQEKGFCVCPIGLQWVWAYLAISWPA